MIESWQLSKKPQTQEDTHIFHLLPGDALCHFQTLPASIPLPEAETTGPTWTVNLEDLEASLGLSPERCPRVTDANALLTVYVMCP